ncbi:unnamed protein product [Dicrocoelium dendriticum]|nr:unnamed protein product [Dicrocoelium dendriticum]
MSHRFIVDTGSVESLISKTSLDHLYPDAQLDSTLITIKGITGHTIPVIGCCTLPVLDKHLKPVECKFVVIRQGPSILGLKVMQALKISVNFLSHTDTDTQIRDLLHDCSVTSGGMRIPPVKLEVAGDPVFCKRRVLPFGLREPVRKVLMSLCESGILVPVQSSRWATPIVTPLTPDGQTPRVCGDYRVNLNTKLLQRSCVTEEPDSILSRLHGSKIFSRLDLKDAYLQIPLTDESSELTPINTPFGLYRYRFLPFGLNVSPAIFQDVMNSIVKDLKGVEVYQDDVFVHAINKPTHDYRLLALLTRFKDANVNINPKKCLIGVHEISCLGYQVTSEGFKPDPDRIKQLVDVKSPTNVHELRSLMGALQYYSKFIPGFASIADPLFTLLNDKSFVWLDRHEHVLRKLLKILASGCVLHTFSPKLTTVLFTDASPTGIGAVLEQNGHPVLCISRRLSHAEKGYAQTYREALAVYWAVTRLHKYLFGLRFTIVTDHEALKFIYNPSSSLAKSSAAIVQRWSVALSAYNYVIEHRSAKLIPHVDYLSGTATIFETDSEMSCLLTQPLPISRSALINDTRRYYGSLISAVKRGWSVSLKRKFPQFYVRRDELCVTPDGLLCVNDRIVIPPTLRSAILTDLHSGHLGVEKMKSLARCLCWWPELNADIRRTASDCPNCKHKILRQPSKWTPWPMTCEPWQRKHHALVVVDSYSKWPEVFLTDKPNSAFTVRALRKVFSREGVPLAVVSDNGSHFSASEVTNWLQSLGCRHLFTAPRHPCSNGLAENFFATLKRSITSYVPTSFDELDRCVDNFLLQYRNCVHSSTGDTPAKLCKSRPLRSNMLGLGTAEVSYFRGNDLRPSSGIIVNNIGNRMVRILDLDDCSVHRRHVDQIRYKDSGQLSFNSVCTENTNVDSVSDPHEYSEQNQPPRRSARLQQKPQLNYRNLELHSSCGGCDNCTNNTQ